MHPDHGYLSIIAIQTTDATAVECSFLLQYGPAPHDLKFAQAAIGAEPAATIDRLPDVTDTSRNTGTVSPFNNQGCGKVYTPIRSLRPLIAVSSTLSNAAPCIRPTVD